MRVLAAAALVLLTVAAVRAQQPTLGSGAKFVPILATVLDRDGNLVPGLERQDFTVLDNGKPQDIVFFQNGIQPFTVVLLIDTSFSMRDSLTLVKAAAEQFISRMGPEDTGQVGAFNDKITFGGSFTSDRVGLIRALGQLPVGNPSRFYDAIDASVDRLDNASGHKVVLVFSDGDDTNSVQKLGDVVAKARTQDVMVYAINLRSEFFNGVRMQRSRPSGDLRKLAEETGGGFFELKKTADLAATITRVAQELHSPYALGFTPTTLDGKRHKLEIRVKSGTTVRARRGYLATRDGLTGAN